MLEKANVAERADKFIALAKEHGFQISKVELFRFLEKYEADGSRALPEDTLESVAGGGGGIKDTDDFEVSRRPNEKNWSMISSWMD